jgi:uncharacterized protein YndB with AHSA1/START domain
MRELFVKRSIEINAPASTVWDVLTKPEFTRYWISNFGGIDGEIESDWKMGSPVLWKGADGKVIVEGNVTALNPGQSVRFTVFDVRSERPPISDKDGITYILDSQDGHTVLSVAQGDFGKMPDAEKYYDATVETWEKVLPEIKSLAEG